MPVMQSYRACVRQIRAYSLPRLALLRCLSGGDWFGLCNAAGPRFFRRQTRDTTSIVSQPGEFSGVVFAAADYDEYNGRLPVLLPL